MPAIAENPEAFETLAQVMKKNFQPEPEPRENNPAPAKEPAGDSSAAPITKDKPDAKAKANEAAPQQGAPPSEAETVFGTAPAKAKEDAPKAGDDDFEKILKEETAGMTDRAQARWIEVKRSERAAKKEAQKAREELASREEAWREAESKQPQKDDGLADRVKSLELQLAEAEKSLSVTQVERSQKYRREVAEPLSELAKQVEELAGRYEVPAKTIMAALESDPKERTDLLGELAADFKEGDRIELYQIGKEMDRVRRTGDRLRERAKSDLSALEQEEKDAAERLNAGKRSTLSASAQREWDEAARTADYLRKNEAAPEWNAALADAKAHSLSHVPGEDPIADGKLQARAFQLPFVLKAVEHYKQTLAAITQERDALLERIKSDSDLDPALGGAVDGERDLDEDDGPEGETLGERIKRTTGRR